ncbi:MAG: stage II sporulation protein M [Actinomycetota bacterium]|nr:stage II sporulation protein M [Actinomycetota bacterium]
MNLERFVERGQTAWARLEQLILEARGRPERLGPHGVRELGRLYRSSAADLALARRRWPGDPLTQRLESLVSRTRPLVYDTEVRREGVLTFFVTTYWRLVAERPRLLFLAWGLLLGPALLAAIWALNDPGAALGLVPPEFQQATDPRRGDLGIPVSEQSALASAIFTNNIRVTFLAFAGGIAAGLGTAFVLIYNGTFLGAIAGLAFDSGNGRAFVELVTAHGVLELSCIAVTAAAGLRIGGALISPGRRRRSVALVAAARPAVAIVLGTAPWLVLAGLVEGFLTPAGLGLEATVGVGVALGAIYWGLVLWRGRPEEEGRT